MTPLKFLTYSATFLGDVFVLLVLLSAFRGLLANWVREGIEIYFREKEKFLKRLGDVSLPPDVYRSKMMD